MNDTSGKMAMAASVPSSSSSSANLAMVVDQRPPQRPGGCVSIFFQLFDWNRRLAKKKLFPKKLLPPTKRISKKFGGNEKMPTAKLLLIADENRGGFPNTKKPEADTIQSSRNADRDNGMCSPGLVARLMGLESIPAVHLDKPRKAVDSDLYFDRSDTSGSSRHDQDMNLERSGHGKLESRPQKLQKTGFLDQRPVAALLGSEALQFNRSMLSRSRKQYLKLASPVKSPRLLSRRNSARLMEAATKILEPNLQSRNRAKSALTYIGSLQANAEGINDLSSKSSKEHAGTSYVSPCKNCGSLVELPDVRLNVEEPPVTAYISSSSSSSDFSNASSHYRFNESLLKPPVSLQDESRTQSLAVQAKVNVQSRSRDFVERKSHLQNDLTGQIKQNNLRQNNLRQNQMPLVREKVVSGPKLCSRQQGRRDSNPPNASKDFIALNRNLNSGTRTRMVPKALDSQRMVTDRNVKDKHSLVRKRRPIHSHQNDNISAVNSTLLKQRSVSNVQSGKGPGLISTHPISRNCVKSESRKQGEGECGSGSKDTGIVSFTFSAPMRHDFGSLPSARATERRTDRVKLIHDNSSQSEKLTTDAKNGKSSSQRVTAISGDALSALLEQKIKELTYLDRDELATGDDALSGRSTSSILEELISALTTGDSITQKKRENCSVELSPKNDSCYDSKNPSDCTDSHRPKSNINQLFQAEAKSGVLAGVLLTNDYDQPSPVSILEASFSNDSCLSESLNSSSGHKPHFGFMDSSCEKSQPWDPDTDSSDSATSRNIRMVESDMIPHSLKKISIMHNIDRCEEAFTESKRNHIREVISNAELLFGNTLPYGSYGTFNSSIDPILLDTLETLVHALWVSPEHGLCSTEAKEGVQFRRFLFDCMIEHLDSKYSRYCKSGYKAWAKLLPLFFSADRLTREVYEEIRSWRDDPDGKISAEIIEKEISHLSGKWTDFEIETFEAGMEIENDILQILVDEITIDLLQC